MEKEDKLEERKLQFRGKMQGASYKKKIKCPDCEASMIYIYGEMYECPDCGCRSLSDFGKVKKFLEDKGPQSAIVISDATGVSVEIINEFLRDGRVEIPDGSEQYIKCQKCGADIRYGRFCPDCIKKISGNISKALWTPEAGEKPKKKNIDGKMHFL